VIVENHSNVPNAEVQILFEIDERLAAPNGFADLIAGDDCTGVADK
jgi:hypothetical protein